jgi:acyl CoA:acetate/3-ketoacid CoA transferase beta subunit
VNGDLVTLVLAREIVDAARRGMRVLAVTSVTSLVAGLVARRIGAERLAIATGFGTLDAEPVVSLTGGEPALGAAASPRGPSLDTFVALAQGRVGVAVTPAQLDGRGATNLSQVGGTDAEPGVALPGDRGLPENNDAPGSIWYVFPQHAPRQLVAEVDSVSGPPPSPGRYRRLITPLGTFALDDGWSAVELAEDVTESQVAEGTGFPIAVDPSVARVAAATLEEVRALDAVDPLGCRGVEHLTGADLRDLVASIRKAESGDA